MRRLPLSLLGVIPFFVYVALFLLLPTAIIFGGSLVAPDGTLSLANFVGIDSCSADEWIDDSDAGIHKITTVSRRDR